MSQDETNVSETYVVGCGFGRSVFSDLSFDDGGPMIRIGSARGGRRELQRSGCKG